MSELPERKHVTGIAPDAVAQVNAALLKFRDSTTLNTQRGLALLDCLSRGRGIAGLGDCSGEMAFFRQQGILHPSQNLINGPLLPAIRQAVSQVGNYYEIFTLELERQKQVPAPEAANLLALPAPPRKEKPGPTQWVNGKKLDSVAVAQVNAALDVLVDPYIRTPLAQASAGSMPGVNSQRALALLYILAHDRHDRLHQVDLGWVKEVNALKALGLLDAQHEVPQRLKPAVRAAVVEVAQPVPDAWQKTLAEDTPVAAGRRELLRDPLQMRNAEQEPSPRYEVVPLMRDHAPRPKNLGGRGHKYDAPSAEAADGGWADLIKRMAENGALRAQKGQGDRHR